MKHFFASFKCFLILVFVVSSQIAFSQPRNRNYIKGRISYYGECKNVAITKHNGDVMIYGLNGWAADGCPTRLTNTLDELNDDQKEIKDVQLTENGKWLVLYGGNGATWNDIPYGLESKLREFNSNDEEITSVSFNDAGDWIVVTTQHFSASNSTITALLKEGYNKYGQILTACIADDAAVVVHKNGFSFFGNVPSSLKSELETTLINVRVVKIAGSAWFISDGVSRYEYEM